MKIWKLVLAGALLLPACDDDADGDDHGEGDHDHESEGDHDHEGEDGHDHETEEITKVELRFEPDGGGEAVVAAFSDPDGDAGMSGTSETITLAANTTYTMSVTITNELESPAEDVTEEIKEEAEEHQLFFFGDAVGRLVDVEVVDMESEYGENNEGDDLPVGLKSSVTTMDAGTGEFKVQQQHMPEVNGTPVKVAGLELPDLPGEPDYTVTFPITIE